MLTRGISLKDEWRNCGLCVYVGRCVHVCVCVSTLKYPATFNNMDEHGRCTLHETRQTRQVTWSHLHMELKKIKFLEAKNGIKLLKWIG